MVSFICERLPGSRSCQKKRKKKKVGKEEKDDIKMKTNAICINDDSFSLLLSQLSLEGIATFTEKKNDLWSQFT